MHSGTATVWNSGFARLAATSAGSTFAFIGGCQWADALPGSIPSTTEFAPKTALWNELECQKRSCFMRNYEAAMIEKAQEYADGIIQQEAPNLPAAKRELLHRQIVSQIE